MEQEKVYTVIGLMSGTSTDGVDAALLRTDGLGYVERIGGLNLPYEDALRKKIKAQFGKNTCDIQTDDVAREITLKHVEAVNALMTQEDVSQVDLIGFHGQTIYHAPDQGRTIQIGDADLLAEKTGIDVVYDFRSADVNAGGEGAPFLPLYHQALAHQSNLEKPCVFLNIGGVSNMTWISDSGILAFDCGPGNALIDDAMDALFGQKLDKDGGVASKGNVDELVLQRLMSDEYFKKRPPKSLDRDAWDLLPLENLSPEDKISTLTEFTVQGISNAQTFCDEPPKAWYVCGGGRHNREIMKRLDKALQGDVLSIDSIQINGDMLEAEGFAYLAVRSVKDLPLSLPTTTGVKSPQSGGKYKKVA